MSKPVWISVKRGKYHADDAICDVCEEQMGQARYELGWTYLSMQQPHEARFYLEPLSVLPGKIAPLDIALSQAAGLSAGGETERVRELLRRAYLYGADEATIIEGVSYLSLETGIPERRRHWSVAGKYDRTA